MHARRDESGDGEDRDERSERVAACRACRLIRASRKRERIARDKLTLDLVSLSRLINAREMRKAV